MTDDQKAQEIVEAFRPLAEMGQQYLDQASGYQTLGPNYFAAREIAEKFMADFQALHFAPLLKKFADDFHEKMQEDLEDHLLSNVESNLQSKMWRQIEASVLALLTGKRWALEKYVLTDKYRDGEEVRAAVAKHIPAELQDARIADLEKEVEKLRKDLEWHQRH
jgi:hypothetical protein